LEHDKFFDNDLHGPLENCFRVKFNLYQSVVDFSRIVYFTWRVSDCEELVGTIIGDGENELVYVVIFFLQSIPQAATEGLFGADRVN
jgi:hypothetical protein